MPEAAIYHPDPREPTTYDALPGGDLGSGGSGGGILQVFIDRAPAPPDDPTEAAINYPAGGGPQQEWDVASQTWI